MKFLDLFAGIGGFRLGMEQAGHECVGYVEWDKFARKSYEAIHNTKGEWTAHDIRTVSANDIRGLGADCWCFGFPCQDISIAGKQEGFDGDRSSLFFAVTKLIRNLEEKDRPKYLFIENVKNLLSVNNGFDFAKLLIELDDIGYDAEWEVVNSKNHGVPQNRERVFIIGHLRGTSGRKVFPIGETDGSVGNEIKRLGHSKYFRRVLQTYDVNGSCEVLDTMQGGNRQQCVMVVGNVNPSGNGMNGQVYDSSGLSPTLTTNKGEGIKIFEATKQGYAEAFPGDSVNLAVPNSQTRRGRVGKGVANTLDTSCNQGVVISGLYLNDSDRFHKGPLEGLSRCLKANKHDAGITDGFRIRKLTPKECFRLQGFPDWAYERAAKVNSNSQLYKQTGNSVTVNVIYEIAKRLGETK